MQPAARARAVGLDAAVGEMADAVALCRLIQHAYVDIKARTKK